MNQHQQSVTFTRGLEADAETSIGSEPVKVFVMGPDTKNTSSGARLRQDIIDLCNIEDFAVLGEHPKTIAAIRGILRAGFTMTHHEILLARRSDLIIIIPDSAGSIAELGYFALQKKACEKMVILFDKQYRGKKKSYIAQGPQKAAKDSGATVGFIDYSVVAQAWEMIRPRIEKIRASRVQTRFENTTSQ